MQHQNHENHAKEASVSEIDFSTLHKALLEKEKQWFGNKTFTYHYNKIDTKLYHDYFLSLIKQIKLQGPDVVLSYLLEANHPASIQRMQALDQHNKSNFCAERGAIFAALLANLLLNTESDNHKYPTTDLERINTIWHDTKSAAELLFHYIIDSYQDAFAKQAILQQCLNQDTRLGEFFAIHQNNQGIISHKKILMYLNQAEGILQAENNINNIANTHYFKKIQQAFAHNKENMSLQEKNLAREETLVYLQYLQIIVKRGAPITTVYKLFKDNAAFIQGLIHYSDSVLNQSFFDLCKIMLQAGLPTIHISAILFAKNDQGFSFANQIFKKEITENEQKDKFNDFIDFITLQSLLELQDKNLTQQEIKMLITDSFNKNLPDYYQRNKRNLKANIFQILQSIYTGDALISLLEAALDANTILGRFFYFQRGTKPCNPNHGTLYKIKLKLHTLKAEKIALTNYSSVDKIKREAIQAAQAISRREMNKNPISAADYSDFLKSLQKALAAGMEPADVLALTLNQLQGRELETGFPFDKNISSIRSNKSCSELALAPTRAHNLKIACCNGSLVAQFQTLIAELFIQAMEKYSTLNKINISNEKVHLIYDKSLQEIIYDYIDNLSDDRRKAILLHKVISNSCLYSLFFNAAMPVPMRNTWYGKYSDAYSLLRIKATYYEYHQAIATAGLYCPQTCENKLTIPCDASAPPPDNEDDAINQINKRLQILQRYGLRYDTQTIIALENDLNQIENELNHSECSVPENFVLYGNTDTLHFIGEELAKLQKHSVSMSSQENKNQAFNLEDKCDNLVKSLLNISNALLLKNDIAYNIYQMLFATTHQYGKSVNLLTQFKPNTDLGKEIMQVRYQLLLMRFMQNHVSDKSLLHDFKLCLAVDGAAAKQLLYNLIVKLDSQQKVQCLTAALDQNTTLGKCFYMQRGFQACSTNRGVLKQIQQAYNDMLKTSQTTDTKDPTVCNDSNLLYPTVYTDKSTMLEAAKHPSNSEDTMPLTLEPTKLSGSSNSYQSLPVSTLFAPANKPIIETKTKSKTQAETPQAYPS